MAEDDLNGRLRELARTPTLLVACDYDGTLSPIVSDPELAYPERESVAALRALAALPDTHVAVVSGRSLRDLAALSRLPSEIHLVGSHGSEFDAGFARELGPEIVALREMVTRRLTEIAARDPGFQVEKKPASAAFHYRNADPANVDAAVEDVLSGPAALSGVSVKHGKMVVELAVVETDKGTALDTLRRQVAADAVLFMGDDVTDEDAFARLGGPDLGVKVGDGDTAAELRTGTTEDVAKILALLLELRRAWLQGAGAPRIEQHSLLSDLRTVALVTPDARINWLCHPRPDSPAAFAELVGGPHSGFWAVRPKSGGEPLTQRYLRATHLLETRWAGMTLLDFLDASRADQPAGHSSLLRMLEGDLDAAVEFAPRLDYGRAPTRIEITADGLRVTGTSQDVQLLVRTKGPVVTWVLEDDGPHQTARATVRGKGRVTLELAFEAHDLELESDDERRAATERLWRDWSESLRLPAVETEACLRSALAIKALCHQPTGALLAAATTSLPEVPGGVRNWDYRYCWPRDAALSATALVELGSLGEARALLRWIMDRLDHVAEPEQLRPLYAVAGDEFLPEAVLPTLHGYLGSRPVRIGNAADQQVQLDVFGPIVALVRRLAEAGHDVTADEWQLVCGMVEAVSRRWQDPDHGIWEERRPQRHHVYSKVMCWQAVDAALTVASLSGHCPDDAWGPLRESIAQDILERGWNEEAQAFTIAYGDLELDAAALWIGLSGLLPADDPRFVSTVAAIERDLCRGPIVYRYRLDDGLPGEEGGFLLCTAWLILAYVQMGRFGDARGLFKSYCALAGPTGLLSEQYDPGTSLMLGNHPQAYSHLGLIQAAVALSREGS